MGELTDCEDSKLNFDTVCPKVVDMLRPIGDGSASSSGSKLRWSFIDMGFSPSLVDKVIQEKGEDDADLIMETIFSYSKSPDARSDSLDDLLVDNKDEIAVGGHLKQVLQKSGSSDSLDSLFGDQAKTGSSLEVVDVLRPKEEPDVSSREHDDKRAVLLMMKFPVNEVNFALDKLGENAPVSDLVDFIFAAQIDRKHKQAADTQTQYGEGKSKDDNAESLFGTMEKTLRLLEMGFSENQISAAIDKYGVQVPVSELAGYIFEDPRIDEKYEKGKSGNNCGSSGNRYPPPFEIKTEDFTPETVPQVRDPHLEKYMGKRIKEEYNDDPESVKRPKLEYDDTFQSVVNPIFGDRKKPDSKSSKSLSLSTMKEPRKKIKDATLLAKPKSCRSLDEAAAKPPYFFFGCVSNLSQNSWTKISQFLYAIEPEFTNAQFFSAMIRQEGYVHNLPTESRCHILPKSPLTIEEAIPRVKKWWPSWDTRKQLSSINPETSGISQVCEKIERMVTNSNGTPSVDQQMDIIQQCSSQNLLWVGPNKLGRLDPEQLEGIMGYPINHTRLTEFSIDERLQALKHGFQIDTLGYHLSSVKPLLPKDGVVVLSIYSGIGGTEIAMNRLGIRLKGVVSVEPSEGKRKILNKWWQNSGQSGELVQLDDIHKLSTNKLESLIKKFGTFNFVTCQNLSNGNPQANRAGDSFAGLDFSLFCEFVRVLQRVRDMIGRIK